MSTLPASYVSLTLPGVLSVDTEPPGLTIVPVPDFCPAISNTLEASQPIFRFLGESCSDGIHVPSKNINAISISPPPPLAVKRFPKLVCLLSFQAAYITSSNSPSDMLLLTLPLANVIALGLLTLQEVNAATTATCLPLKSIPALLKALTDDTVYSL